MLPNFLIPDSVIREAGAGPEIGVESAQGGMLLLTLGISRILEQQSLDVAIWGSPNGSDWGVKPLASFPQKFYCGTYHILVDLGHYPTVTKLKAKWQVNRWGRGDTKPLFGAYLAVEDAKIRAIAKTA